jgi:spermidine/putrescine-binding protein
MNERERLTPSVTGNVPNFNNIPANFRDLGYDRGNKYSIPYLWNGGAE